MHQPASAAQSRNSVIGTRRGCDDDPPLSAGIGLSSGFKVANISNATALAASAAISCQPFASELLLPSSKPEIPRITHPCTGALTCTPSRNPRPSIPTSGEELVLFVRMRDWLLSC